VGLVLQLWEVFNQDDACVMTMKGYGMLRQRGLSPPADAGNR
jgi:hypothetical protein